MSRFLLALALLSTVALTGRTDDKPETKEFASKEGRFKATFPSKTSESTTEAKGSGLAIVTVSSQPKPGSVFNVVYFDLPSEIPADQAKATLPKLASGIKGKELSVKDLELGKEKVPGRDAVYEVGKTHIRNVIFLDGKRVYQVLVGGVTKDEVTSKEADKFIESFRIVK